MVRWSCPSTVSYRYPIYFKTNCDTAAKKLHKIVTGLQGENLELKNDIAILQTRVGKVEEFNQTIDDKFTEVNTNTDNKLVTLKAEIAGEMNVKYATTENTDNQLVLLKDEITEEMNGKILAATSGQEDFQKFKDEMTAEMNAKFAELTGLPDEEQTEGNQGANNWQTVHTNRRRWEVRQGEVQEEMINEALSEKYRIEKRKCNLIATQVKESDQPNEDRVKLQELLNKLHITEEIIISDITRLGTRSVDYDRMLRFTVQDVKTKKLILSKATTLRQLEDTDAFYKVYIKPDLTPKQAEASKNLVDKLKEILKKDVNRFWKIRREKIIEVDANGNALQ